MEELEEGFEYNEDDVRDIQHDNKKLVHEVYELNKQLMYMETYSKRENLKFLGVPQNTDVLGTSNDMEEGTQQWVASENTKEVSH